MAVALEKHLEGQHDQATHNPHNHGAIAKARAEKRRTEVDEVISLTQKGILTISEGEDRLDAAVDSSYEDIQSAKDKLAISEQEATSLRKASNKIKAKLLYEVLSQEEQDKLADLKQQLKDKEADITKSQETIAMEEETYQKAIAQVTQWHKPSVEATPTKTGFTPAQQAAYDEAVADDLALDAFADKFAETSGENSPESDPLSHIVEQEQASHVGNPDYDSEGNYVGPMGEDDTESSTPEQSSKANSEPGTEKAPGQDDKKKKLKYDYPPGMSDAEKKAYRRQQRKGAKTVAPPKPTSKRYATKGEWEKHLTSEQRHAINQWTGSEYSTIRAEQFETNNTGVSHKSSLTKDFEKALETAPLYQGQVYRGINLNSDEVKAQMVEGGVLHWKATSSTSVSIDTARGFGSTLFVINMKTGTDIRGMGYHTNEREVLAQNNSYYRIDSVKYGTNSQYNPSTKQWEDVPQLDWIKQVTLTEIDNPNG